MIFPKFKAVHKKTGKECPCPYTYCLDPSGNLCSWDESQGWEVIPEQDGYRIELVPEGITDVTD